MIGMMNNPSNSVEFYSARRGSQEAEVEFVEGPKKSHVQYAADGRKIIDGKVVPEPAGRLWTRTLLSGAINHAMGTGSNPEVVDDEEVEDEVEQEKEAKLEAQPEASNDAQKTIESRAENCHMGEE